MANMTLSDIRAEPYVFYELPIVSLTPETTLIRKYCADIAAHIFFSVKPKFKAEIEESDIRITCSSNERKYTLRTGTSLMAAAMALFSPTLTVPCDDLATMVLSAGSMF